MSEESPAGRDMPREIAAPAAIFAVAFAVRLAIAIEAWRTLPFLRGPVVDGAEYFLRAREVAAGAFWPVRMELHPPLYGWMLGSLFRCFGYANFGVFVVQALMGAGTAVLLWRWTRTLAGARAAKIAGVLAAFAWPLAFQEIHVSAAGPTVFLLAAAAVAADWAAKGSPLRALAPGALVGLAGIAHGMALAFVAILLPPLRERTRQAAAAVALALAAAAMPPLAVCAHNAGLDGGSYTLQANAGLNLWLGNGESANGYPNLVVGPPFEDVVNRASDAGAITVRQQDRYFVGETVRWIGEQPLRWLALLGAKMLATWSSAEVDSSMDAGLFERSLSLDALAFVRWGWLLGLAVPGCLLLWRRSPARIEWLAVAIAGAAPVILLVTSNRYRVPLMLAAIPAAAVALEALWTERRGRVAMIAAAVAGAALSYANLLGVGGEEYFPNARMLGMSYALLEDWPQAEEHTRAARAAAPHDPQAALQLGKIYYCTARPDRALEETRAALALRADFVDALDIAGRILGTARRGEMDALYASAVAAAPRNPRIHAQWGAFARKAGGDEEAASHYAQAVTLQPGIVEYRAGLGGALLALRRFAPAEIQFRAILEAEPYDPEANYRMALCRLEQGDREGARRYAAEAAESGHDEARALLEKLR